MSALAEQSGESDMYVPERSFRLIQGSDTAERFIKMHKLLNKNRAAQFWGVEEQWAKIHGAFFNTFVPRTVSTESRLIAIKYALREVPEPDIYTEDIAYVTPIATIISGFKKTSAKRIPNLASKHKNAKLPITYLEAHNTPEIRSEAVTTLCTEGNPVVEVVRSLEGWRYANADKITITDAQLREGHETFDVLLLSSVDAPYAMALGHAATMHLR